MAQSSASEVSGPVARTTKPSSGISRTSSRTSSISGARGEGLRDAARRTSSRSIARASPAGTAAARAQRMTRESSASISRFRRPTAFKRVVGTEGVGADELRAAVGLVRRGPDLRAHLVERAPGARAVASCQAHSGARETRADDRDDIAHDRILRTAGRCRLCGRGKEPEGGSQARQGGVDGVLDGDLGLSGSGEQLEGNAAVSNRLLPYAVERGARSSGSRPPGRNPSPGRPGPRFHRAAAERLLRSAPDPARATDRVRPGSPAARERDGPAGSRDRDLALPGRRPPRGARPPPRVYSTRRILTSPGARTAAVSGRAAPRGARARPAASRADSRARGAVR